MKTKSEYFVINKSNLVNGARYSFNIYIEGNRASPALFLEAGEEFSLSTEILPWPLLVSISQAEDYFKVFKIDERKFWSDYGKFHDLEQKYSQDKKENPRDEKFSYRRQLGEAVRSNSHTKLLKQCRAEVSEVRYNYSQWQSTVKGVVEEMLRREDDISKRAVLCYALGKICFKYSRDHLLNLLALSFLDSFGQLFQDKKKYQEVISLFLDEMNLKYDPRILMTINDMEFPQSEDYKAILRASFFLSQIESPPSRRDLESKELGKKITTTLINIFDTEF